MDLFNQIQYIHCYIIYLDTKVGRESLCRGVIKGNFSWLGSYSLSCESQSLCSLAALELGGSLQHFESGFCFCIRDKSVKQDSLDICALLDAENNVNLK